MPMLLSQEDLAGLSTKLEQVDRSGVQVRQIEHAGHTIFLTWDENGSHLVRGIDLTPEKDKAKTPVMRDRS